MCTDSAVTAYVALEIELNNFKRIGLASMEDGVNNPKFRNSRRRMGNGDSSKGSKVKCLQEQVIFCIYVPHIHTICLIVV